LLNLVLGKALHLEQLLIELFEDCLLNSCHAIIPGSGTPGTGKSDQITSHGSLF
jgi:hypothetical protein